MKGRPMSNMEDFNRGVALILAKLYKAFPQKSVIYVNQLDPNAGDETVKNFSATIEFLAAEGFIRCGSSAGGGKAFANVVLTTKGLSILNSVPDSIKEKISLGNKIIDALKSGSKEAL